MLKNQDTSEGSKTGVFIEIRHEIVPEVLAFTNRVTRATGEHQSKTIQADAVNQLKWDSNFAKLL